MSKNKNSKQSSVTKKKVQLKEKNDPSLSPKQSKPVCVQHTQTYNPKDRFYCTNANLLKEMYKWRNSSTNGLPVYKMDKNGNLVLTKIDENTDQKHEVYKKGTRYFIKYPKTHKRYLEWATKKQKIETKQKNELAQNRKYSKLDVPSFYREDKNSVIEDITDIVENDGWAFDIDDPLDPVSGRKMSEEFGIMIMMIAQRLSNHSCFRNYSLEIKQDCQSYSYVKIIRGLFNYSFKYTNAFAYLTQACFNSFKSILAKHYKHVNLKRSLTKRAIVDLEANLPGSTMRRSLNNQFEGNDYDSFQEF